MTYTPDDIIKRHFRHRREQKIVFAIVTSMLGVMILIVGVSPSISAQVSGSGTQTSASIGENPINSLYAQLEERSQNLATREAELIEREIVAGVSERSRQSSVIMYALFGLLILVFLNALFDIFEMRELKFLERQIKRQGAV